MSFIEAARNRNPTGRNGLLRQWQIQIRRLRGHAIIENATRPYDTCSSSNTRLRCRPTWMMLNRQLTSPFVCLTKLLPFCDGDSNGGAKSIMSRDAFFYHFGAFVLDPSEHRLMRDGRTVPLSKRPMAVLVVLIERAGHLVTKEELLVAAWGDTIVVDNALSVAISRLRHVLRTSGDSSPYIETVPGYGYRFVAPVVRTDHPVMERLPASTVAGGTQRTVTLRPRRNMLAGGLIGGSILLAFLWWYGFPAMPLEVPWAGRSEASLTSTIIAESDPTAVARRHAAAHAYSRGRELLDTRRPGTEALAAFSLARAVDSTYAPAYLGLADVYAMGHRSSLEAIAMLDKALALDPDLGEAHATLGFVHAFQRWDWNAAEAAFDIAMARAPEYKRTHQWYGAFLLVHRRFDEAEAALEKALTLDPASANLHSDLCEIRIARRSFEAAMESCQNALALDPDFPFARGHVFWLHLLQGELDDAVSRSPFGADLLPGRLVPLGAPPEHYLEALASHFARTAPTVPHDAYFLARLQALRGDADSALRALGWAINMRSFHAPFVNADPAFDYLRNDADFQKLIHEVGLE